MANRIFFWIFFVLMLICVAGLGVMTWAGTRPTQGANMVFMGLPMVLGPMAVFAFMTWLWGNKLDKPEGLLAKVAIGIAAIAFAVSILGVSFA